MYDVLNAVQDGVGSTIRLKTPVTFEERCKGTLRSQSESRLVFDTDVAEGRGTSEQERHFVLAMQTILSSLQLSSIRDCNKPVFDIRSACVHRDLQTDRQIDRSNGFCVIMFDDIDHVLTRQGLAVDFSSESFDDESEGLVGRDLVIGISNVELDGTRNLAFVL